MTMNCTVCDNPQAPNYHFGARACKACAAFFRRSISMHQQYECQEKPNNMYGYCKIYYESRFNCRFCRLKKCFNSGMSKDLVQAKSGITVTRSKRKCKTTKVYYPTDVIPTTSYEEPIFYQKSDNEWDYSIPEKMMRYEDGNVMCAEEFQQFMTFEPMYIPKPSSSEESFCDDFAESEIRTRLNSFAENRDFNEDTFAYQTSELYVDQTLILNRGRKLTFTDVMITKIFDDTCLCPFSVTDLKQFNHRIYSAKKRPEYTIVLNYITKFPEFNMLTGAEKSVLYRTALGVELLVNQMFYSYTLFENSDVLVLTNGWFINMNPLPDPEREKYSGYFESDEDYCKYEWWMNMKRRQWLNVVVPLKRMNLSFTEMALFKAMIIWHHNHFKMEENGRRICERQRDLILKSLLVICADEGYDNPQLRVAELITAMSCVMIEVYEMRANYIEGTMFDIIDDPTLSNIVSNLT